MEVHDFDGACRVEHDDELLARLRSVRRGADGAFILDHGEGGSLWVHINGDVAFLWFCPDNDGNHPGFVPDGMWSGDRCDVRFLLVDGYEGDAIVPAWYQLLPIDAAYKAAVEYLHSPSLPASVTWFELSAVPHSVARQKDVLKWTDLQHMALYISGTFLYCVEVCGGRTTKVASGASWSTGAV